MKKIWQIQSGKIVNFFNVLPISFRVNDLTLLIVRNVSFGVKNMIQYRNITNKNREDNIQFPTC